MHMHRTTVACVLLFLAVSVRAAPTVTIIELGGKDERAFTDVVNPIIRIPLTLRESAGRNVNVVLEATPFVSASGESVQPAFVPSEIKIAARGTTLVHATAFLPSAGAYKSTIRGRVLWGKKQRVIERIGSFTIAVTRVKAQAPIDVLELPAMQHTMSWTPDRISVPLEIRVFSTGGPVTFNPPELVNPIRKEKADAKAGVSAATKLAVAKEPIGVDAGNPATIAATLEIPNVPGSYEGKLRFAPPGYQPTDTPVTVYVRSPWWLAFALVAAGVLLSLVVHAYGASVRPRLLLQQRIAALRSELATTREKAGGDAAAVAMIVAIEEAMRVRWEDARRRRRRITSELDVYEIIVPAAAQWVALHARLQSVRPISVRDGLMPALDTAREEFTAAAPDATRVQTAIDAMKKLPEAIRTKVLEALQAGVKSMQALLANDNRPVVVDIRNALEQVLAKLGAKQVEAAAGAFDAARLRYVALLAADLRARVELPAGKEPVGIDANDWKKLQNETIQALDALDLGARPDDAMGQLALATRQYLNALGAAIQRTAANVAADDRAKIATAVSDMATAGAADDFTKAWQKLDEAQKLLIAAIENQTGSALGPEEVKSLAAAAKAPAVGFNVIDVIDPAPSWESFGGRDAVEALRRKIGVLDFVISVIVLIVASLVVIQGVWADDPTWGGWLHYIAAFVGGFAADQFTHAGVLALSGKS